MRSLVLHQPGGLPRACPQHHRAGRCGVAFFLAALTFGGRGAAGPSTSQTVSAEVAGETLALAVHRTGEAAKVPLAVDRSLADYRVFLFAHDQPLGALRKQLQEFVPTAPGTAWWFARGSVLVLQEDLLSRTRRAGEAAARRRQAIEHRAQGYQSMLEWCEPKRTDSPDFARQRLHDARLVRIFAGFQAAARQAAINGSVVAVPFQDLNQTAQDLVRQAVKGQGSGVEGYPQFAFDGDKDAAKVLVVVTPKGTAENPGLRLWLNCRPSQNGPQFPDIVHPPRWDPLKGWSWDHLSKDPPGRTRGPKAPSSDPKLAATISLEGGPAAVIESVLAEFARTTRLPVLGEYDPCYRGAFGPSGRSRRTLPPGAVTRATARDALEIIARTFDLTWDYQAGWIWLRSPRTSLARADQLDLSPPEAASSEQPRR